MHKKLTVAVVVALALVVASITLASASSPSASSATTGDKDRVQVIHLVSKSIQEVELDLGEPGTSLGDQFVLSNNLFRDGKKVGTSGGTCSITFFTEDFSTLTANCVLTLSLPRGQITVQGLVSFTDPHPPVVAITGGTGAYRTAHGEMKVRFAEAGDRLTLFLIL
jgi:hypothetical protein